MKKAKKSLIRLEDVICSGVFVKMQNFFRNFIKNSYIYFLIFLLGLGLRIYALSTYPPLHIDEPCTFAVSTSASELDKGIRFKKSWNDFAFRYGQEYSSQEIQRAFFLPRKSFSAIADDLSVLRDDNIDRQHPTLYYTIMRLWNSTLGEFEPHKYIKHARNFNLLLYLFSFFFMFKLLQSVKDDVRFISLGLFFAFVNSGSIMLDTMAREYSLMAAFFVLVTYISFLLSQTITTKSYIKLDKLIVYPPVFSLFLLSGYYALVYAAIVFGVLFLLCICYRRWNSFLKIFIILLLACVYTLIFYPDYFDFSFHNEHYETVKSNAFVLFNWQKLIDKLPTLKTHLDRYIFNGYVFSSVLIFALIPFLFPNWKGTLDCFLNKKVLLCVFGLLFCSFLWAIAVNHTVVYAYYARYVLPAGMIYTLLMVIFVYRFKVVSLFIVLSLLCFSTIKQIRNGSIFDVDRIYYTNSEGTHVSTYTTVPENLPIIISAPFYYPVEHFMFASVSPSSNVPVRFEHGILEKDFGYEKYVLVCSKKVCGDKNIFLNIRGDLGVYLMDSPVKPPQS